MVIRIITALVLALALNGRLAEPVNAAVPGTNDRVSSSSSGTQGNAESNQSSMSADGRYVAFFSSATNLVSGDTNAKTDIFMKDRTTGTTVRVSVDSSGTQANNDSSSPSISANGRYIVFQSTATNLVAGDTNAHRDIFRHDLTTGSTILISQSTSGSLGNADSGYYPTISNDGRFIAFESSASNLVSGDTNAHIDVFVRDAKLGTTKRISVASDGTTQGNADSAYSSISGDGRFVTYVTFATNLDGALGSNPGHVIVTDRISDTTTDIMPSANAGSGNPTISNDGSTVAFVSGASNLVSGDTNAKYDVFSYNIESGAFIRVSVDSSGNQSNDDSSDFPSISGDGRYVSYISVATNLAANDTDSISDAFLYDSQSGTTQLLSTTSTTKGNGDTISVALSPDGHYATMMTAATNLVSGDTNGAFDSIAADTGNTAVTYCAK